MKEDGKYVPVKENMFLHPQTLKIYLIDGNVLYDPSCGRIIISVDVAIACADQKNRYIPFIPYPKDILGWCSKSRFEILKHDKLSETFKFFKIS